MKIRKSLVPDYYTRFRCIGSECEDSCCVGWSVTIDRDTYNRYKQHKNKALAPLFREAIHKAPVESAQKGKAYGIMQLKDDGSCAFLQEDKLCSIQRQLGERALCNTCAMFPRETSLFGSQVESSLGISCPEAARLILLHPEPIAIGLTNQSPEVEERQAYDRIFMRDVKDTESLATWRELRNLVIRILQHRQLSLNARLMLLGLLVESVDQVINAPAFRNASEIHPAMGACGEALQHADVLQSQYSEIYPNQPFKLATIGGILGGSLGGGARARFAECLLDAMDALHGGDAGADIVARYEAAYTEFYRPFFLEHSYILENYLVNEVHRRVFPIMDESPIQMYRELVCNYAIARFILVGMAGANKGLSEELVVKLFQSFARTAYHDSAYLKNLLAKLHEQNSESLVHMLWLLREQDE